MSNLKVLTEKSYIDGPGMAVFWKTKEKHGELSNMCAGFPIRINGLSFRTAEALYQCCKFPTNREQDQRIQNEIREQKSPLFAAKVGRKYVADPKWMVSNVDVMWWVIQMKLMQNLKTFGPALMAVKGTFIVEKSRRDTFWGALEQSDGSFYGANVLGKLLTHLKAEYVRTQGQGWIVHPPENYPIYINGYSVGAYYVSA